MRSPRTAIIDIGSNSIRLVVYQGPVRLPAVLFNEKILAGLGRGLASHGAIDAEALAAAAAALRRFAALTRAMECNEVLTVATAAVRDAANGAELIAAARDCGLEVRLLSGDEEACASGHGVISGFPDADGIVGDLGGGSLELVRVVCGAVGERASFPLGALRLAPLRAKKGMLARHVRRTLAGAGWLGAGAGLPFYLVGGSWRALARLDMAEHGYLLPALHGYRMAPARVATLARKLQTTDRASLKEVPFLSGGRIPTLAAAADLLAALLGTLDSSDSVVSALGLREGLLHQRLSPTEAAADPLIVAAREEGRQLGRFPEHGDQLDRWIAPLFVGEGPADARLRHAACLLADTSWRANAEFRVDLGIENALHGPWVGVDARERAIIAAALAASLGAQPPYPAPLPALAGADDLVRATRWGLAIRLAQRLSGGVAGPLARTRLSLDDAHVTLSCEPADRALWGEAVEKRLRAVATALGREGALV